MNRHSKRRYPPGFQFRSKGFEKMNAKLGMDQLAHQAAIRRRDAETRAKEELLHGLGAQRKREEQAMKLARRIRRAEYSLELAKRQHELYINDPIKAAMWYEGYERHMPIGNPDTDRSARKALGLTQEEIYAIIAHPEMFPNPRLVYDLFANVYWMMWDGKK